MDGATLNAGSVAAVQRIANPVSLARLVMEKTEHVLLAAHNTPRMAHAYVTAKGEIVAHIRC